MKCIVSLIWINMTQHALVCLFVWVNHYSWSRQEYWLSRLTLTTSSSVDWHCTASDTSVTVPSVPTVTTFTGTATVFPFSTAVFRISVSCDTHKTCLTDYIHQSLIGSVLPFFIYALIHSVCIFLISSVIHSLTVLLIPSLCSLSFPYNCSFIGLVIPIFISFFFILISLIHCWFVCSSLPFINRSSFHSSLLLSFFPFITVFLSRFGTFLRSELKFSKLLVQSSHHCATCAHQKSSF